LELGGLEEEGVRARELIEGLAASGRWDEDEAAEVAQLFEREPKLRHAVTRAFMKNLKSEDPVCDSLRRLTATTVETTVGTLVASFLPHAIKQVISSVYHDATDFKAPLHRFVIASNNLVAKFYELGMFDAELPDLRAPSDHHTPKLYHAHANLKKHDKGGDARGRAVPRTFTGQVVNSCLSSELFVGSFSCIVYFIRRMGACAHLDVISLCLHTICHGIKSLEYKIQVIVGNLREDTVAVEQDRVKVLIANLLQIYSINNKEDQTATVLKVVRALNSKETASYHYDAVRYAISGDMYIVMSQALGYLKKHQKDPLVSKMTVYACHLMRERALVDLNSEGIMLSECLCNM